MKNLVWVLSALMILVLPNEKALAKGKKSVHKDGSQAASKYEGGPVGGAGGDAGGGDTGNGDEGDGSNYESPDDGSQYNGPSHGDPRSYCSRALSILERAMLKGRNQYVRQRDENGAAVARATLRKGIADTIAMYTSWPNRNYKPLTVEALHRAIELDLAFNNNCGGGSAAECQPNRRSLRFLYGFIQHINNSILPLDEQYYIPYHENGCFHGSCSDDMWEVFISHYKETAISLLEVYVGRGPDGELPEALGNDIYEMRVASKLFGWVAWDLRRDDLNRIFRCEIGQLGSTAQMLKEQLASAPGDGLYYDNTYAVRDAREVAHEALHHIENYQCRIGRW